MYLTVNLLFHVHMKHIEIDFHFISERVACKLLQVLYIRSSHQLADILTKPLLKSRIHWVQNKLNVIPTLSSREDVKYNVVNTDVADQSQRI